MIFSTRRAYKPQTETKMAKLRRDNHYLPGCYQRGFADPYGLVWVKRAGKDPTQRAPRSVGRKRNLYIRDRRGIETDEVERFFDKDVEGQFASLSQRVQAERDKLSTISAQELGALARFVASQAVRTLAHKQCIAEQAGRAVDNNTFVGVVLRQIRAIVNSWRDTLPKFDFYTPLPRVGDRYITRDHPVLVMVHNDGPIWLPQDASHQRITNLLEILANPRQEFTVSLSPYVLVSIHGPGDGKPQLPPQTVDPRQVRFFNDLISAQCKFFTLARDRESLM